MKHSLPFRIKVCGVTRVDDAVAAVEAGATALGLNFYDRSPRCIGIGVALEIAAELPGVPRIGVFVNSSEDEIRATVSAAHLTSVQLHGDEPPELVARLSDQSVIRARRVGLEGVAPVAADLEACLAAGKAPVALLLDGATPGQFGGTGQVANWGSIRGYSAWTRGVPLVLAGGLKPENVAAAIRAVEPDAVDTASGVESAPGIKDHGRMRDFISAAWDAWGLSLTI